MEAQAKTLLQGLSPTRTNPGKAQEGMHFGLAYISFGCFAVVPSFPMYSSFLSPRFYEDASFAAFCCDIKATGFALGTCN